MKTLGIDLASDPRKTGVCVVKWEEGQALVERIEVGADDEDILEEHGCAETTGIDSPFGWPLPFARLLSGDAPKWDGPWSNERRDDLRFRATDRRVRELIGRWPLSVSTDLIGVPALRCAGLLERMGVTDRSGNAGVYETYPASALFVWGMQSSGYKGTKKRKEREELWNSLKRRAPRLRLTERGQEELILATDDALDALVAALIARAAAVGQTELPNDDEKSAAVTEGWIHVPRPGSLQRLC